MNDTSFAQSDQRNINSSEAPAPKKMRFLKTSVKERDNILHATKTFKG